jgi:hypothetical protein
MSNTVDNIAEAIGQVIGVGLIVGAIAFGVSACSGKKEEPKAAVTPSAVVAPVVAAVELTPEQKKAKEFDSARTTYGYLLTQMIKKSAYDEDALKLKRPEYFKNGVCVQANGKNRFGAYVGWQEHCYLVDAKGQWKYNGPNNG